MNSVCSLSIIKCVLFTRLCGDLVAWSDEIAAQLGTEDNGGHDLSSCKMLLLRHETLARQIKAHEAKLAEIEALLAGAESQGNFLIAKMHEAAELARSVGSFFFLLESLSLNRSRN